MPLFAICLFTLGLAVGPGRALAKSEVQKECSEKYKAAKTANTLNGQTYNQFYKQCSAEAKAGGAATPVAAPAPAAPAPTMAPTTAAEPVKPPVAATATPARTPARTPAAPASTMPVGNAVFPSAISPAHASESPGKARQDTCLDQYHANKATNANGGLKWIEKGGGYYSECNKRLKG